jgi:hypothetical protein
VNEIEKVEVANPAGDDPSGIGNTESYCAYAGFSFLIFVRGIQRVEELRSTELMSRALDVRLGRDS